MKRSILIYCLALGSLLLLSTQGTAWGRNLTVIQSIALEGVYDDNIYLTNSSVENEEQDWITHVRPTIGLDLYFVERGGMALGYRGDFAYYKDNHRNDWQTHTGFFSFNYEAPAGLIVGINNTYTHAEDPYGSDSQYGLGDPTKRWNNDLKGKIGYKFGQRFKILGFYNYYKQAYDLERDRTQDYHDTEFGYAVQMRLLPRTWGFIRYHFGERDYYSHPASASPPAIESDDADFKWHRINTGLAWEPSAKMTGEVNFGYQWKNYDNETDPRGDAYEDKNTWIAATAVSFAATSTTTLSLNVTRALRESGSNTNEFFEDTSIGLGLTKALMSKVSLSLNGSYGKNEYNIDQKKQYNYLASIGAKVPVKDWLSAGVRYTYKRKDSSRGQDEFTDNQLMISLSAQYPSSR